MLHFKITGKDNQLILLFKISV